MLQCRKFEKIECTLMLLKKNVFRLVLSVEQRVSMKNRTSHLRIPLSDALPLSHRNFRVC